MSKVLGDSSIQSYRERDEDVEEVGVVSWRAWGKPSYLYACPRGWSEWIAWTLRKE
jgi:hypothetical protein